jgi:hypothetical protein
LLKKKKKNLNPDASPSNSFTPIAQNMDHDMREKILIPQLHETWRADGAGQTFPYQTLLQLVSFDLATYSSVGTSFVTKKGFNSHT